MSRWNGRGRRGEYGEEEEEKEEEEGEEEGVCAEEEEENGEEKEEEEGLKLNLSRSVTSGCNVNRNVNRKMIESLQTGGVANRN